MKWSIFSIYKACIASNFWKDWNRSTRLLNINCKYTYCIKTLFIVHLNKSKIETVTMIAINLLDLYFQIIQLSHCSDPKWKLMINGLLMRTRTLGYYHGRIKRRKTIAIEQCPLKPFRKHFSSLDYRLNQFINMSPFFTSSRSIQYKHLDLSVTRIHEGSSAPSRELEYRTHPIYVA